jgi:hypothetical protein
VVLEILTPRDADGRASPLTDAEWEVMRQKMTAQGVLELALSNPRVAGIPRIVHAADPYAELRRAVVLQYIFDEPIGNTVLLGGEGSTFDEAELIMNSMMSALYTKRPVPFDYYMPAGTLTTLDGLYREGPLDRPWKTAAATLVSFLASCGVLYLPLPGRNGRRAPAHPATPSARSSPGSSRSP